AAERQAADAAAARRAELAALADAAAKRLEEAIEDERAAAAERETAREAADAAEAARQETAERAVSLGSALAAQNGRLEALDARLAEEESRGIARAARRRGGRRLDENLVVDPPLRAAVEAALDERARAYLVAGEAVADLATERGMVFVEEIAGAGAATPRDAAERRFLERAADAGATSLADAVRRDPVGAATRLLNRAVAVPDLAAALDLQSALPPGWLLVVRDGSAVVEGPAVRFGKGDSPLERQAEAARLRTEVDRLAGEASDATAAAEIAAAEAAAARRRLDEVRLAESAATGERRAAEEGERAAARALETASREASWSAAQADAIEAEAARLREAVTAHESAADRPAAPGGAASPSDGAAMAAWEARAGELRATRDRLAADVARRDATTRDEEARRARAEATVAIDEERIARAERDLAALSDGERRLLSERDEVAAATAIAARRLEAATESLNELRAAEAAARARLAAVERDASAARERLRASDDRLRAADRADLEARLGRDALREQLLVELAGLGDLGLERLRAEAGAEVPDSLEAEPAGADDADDEAALLESALAAVVDRWAASPPPSDPPSPGRLAALRRRYHELGAVNPFAVDEYAELKARLETLETQQSDLRQAIVRTRELIAELNAMIAEQFRTTFRALDGAFDARFQQLFGGGYAHLVLTDPGDLSATGIEIVARPPGKKQQALAMLSGGERALTAVALLFAMLEVRPVPFCVLDEVDAALDEANVGRFTTALRELAERTQLIVITHNRGTIEAADALYGVTVGDDSVSRVISLRLDEAQAIAERRRESSLVEAT
ncbi:MAG TPA: hypothetical protein VK871_00760, partial [Candidatus Limnocylindrales bacterium]|nr:hypothetical protein [Candidatus Limnocylindrales bacterium]